PRTLLREADKNHRLSHRGRFSLVSNFAKFSRGIQSENSSCFVRRSVVPAIQDWASPAGRRPQLFAFERQHLSPAVITARWAGDVRRQSASALGTFVQTRGVPAIRCFARA